MDNIVKRAFRKLKSMIYYDKTQRVLREKIAKYQSERNNNFFDSFSDFFVDKEDYSSSDLQRFKKYIYDILDEEEAIDFLCLPKKVKEENIIEELKKEIDKM